MTITKRQISWILGILLTLIVARGVHHGSFNQMDGKTYIATGERFLKGNVQELYEPIPEAAAFGYQPQTSAFFGIFAIKNAVHGFITLRLLNALSLIFTFLLYRRFLAEYDRRSTLIMVYLCVCYWFIFDESFFIGQIDLFLLFLLSSFVFLFIKGHPILGGLVLGFVLQFKPHFALLAAPVIVNSNFLAMSLCRNIREHGNLKNVAIFHPTNLFAASVVASIAGFVTFFILAKGLTVKAYIALFQVFSEITRGYAFFSCCNNVNNSLRSVLFNLFSQHPQAGRWNPMPWTDTGKYNIKIFVIEDDRILYGFYILLVAVAVMLLLHTIWRFHKSGALDRDGFLFFLCFSALPTVSPAFWHTHSIYIFPVWVYFALKIAHVGPRAKWKMLFCVLGGLFIAISNFKVIGGYLADITLIIGSYYFIHLTLFILYLRHARRVIRDALSPELPQQTQPNATQ